MNKCGNLGGIRKNVMQRERKQRPIDLVDKY